MKRLLSLLAIFGMLLMPWSHAAAVETSGPASPGICLNATDGAPKSLRLADTRRGSCGSCITDHGQRGRWVSRKALIICVRCSK